MSDQARTKGLSYAECGVDIDAGNAFVGRIRTAVDATRRPEVLAGLGGFGALFRADFSTLSDPVLVASTDGVGTKLLLLQRYGRHRVAGQDVVAMCLNDIAAQGAEPLFFLDYLATGRLDAEAMAAVVEGAAEACQVCGCSLIGGETAEMPAMYAENHYDIAGFAVGVVARAHVIDGSAIRDGDVMLGLASSGPHSNGFSMVRRLLELGRADLARDRLADGAKAVDAVLAPTRLYVPAVRALRQAGVEVHGLAHITGGGMFDNLERILPAHLAATVDTRCWPVPSVFEYLLSFAEVAFEERYRTFNMGIGFVVVLPEAEAAKGEAVLREAGEVVHRIGRVHPFSGKKVRLIGC